MICVKMHETANETTQPCKPKTDAPSGLVYCLVSVGGGCEIRTREGLPPTRFPTMLTFVHDRPPPSVNSADACLGAAREQSRTEVNETTFETSPSCRACRACGACRDAGAGAAWPGGLRVRARCRANSA